MTKCQPSQCDSSHPSQCKVRATKNTAVRARLFILRVIAVEDGFGHGQSDIADTQPADQTANEAIHQELAHSRESDEQGVGGPKWGPGRDREDDTDFETEEDEDDEEDSAFPDLPPARPGSRRRHHQNGSMRLRDIAILRPLLKRTHHVCIPARRVWHQSLSKDTTGLRTTAVAKLLLSFLHSQARTSQGSVPLPGRTEEATEKAGTADPSPTKVAS